VDSTNAALLVDLYELTMSASYLSQGKLGTATFDLFVRSLPGERSFLVGCGLVEALDQLENMSFNEEALSYLRTLDMFGEDFIAYLHEFDFTGDVWAVAEGELVFAEEPILRVSGPLIEAQMVETFLLNCIGFQTLIASKAARIAIACGDKEFVDFSPRRDHGADAALKAARAAYVGGATATSNVLAGMKYGIPLSGTMAHSYVMSFGEERDAFSAFADDFPEHSVLLIDTFDPITGAHRAAEVGTEMKRRGRSLAGVRIDSGNLEALSKQVRTILDDAGLNRTKVIVSGDLDEYRIASLLAGGSPIDSFGVGTQLGTSGDVPSLGFVYKLVADEYGPKIKLSSEKSTLPGVKQIFRSTRDERFEYDTIAVEDETFEGARPLLRKVMEGGRQLTEPEPLSTMRSRCALGLEYLPEDLRALQSSGTYEVRKSRRLERLVTTTKERDF
jgi:nicotinate phosphoribosyltransferase